MPSFFQRLSHRKEKKDDPLSFLSHFDTIFLIDDSGSMKDGDPITRWELVSKALAAIAPKCTKYDTDGIDLHFINEPDHPSFLGIKNAKTIQKIFGRVRPTSDTRTGHRLKEILGPYLKDCETAYKLGWEKPKSRNVIVITDGIPSDNLETVLAEIGTALDNMEADADQLGVQFVQVGDDSKASDALKFLDDDLKTRYRCRDFVDTQPFDPNVEFSPDFVLKTVLGAVNKRLDRKMMK